jgi:hypothetical protein
VHYHTDTSPGSSGSPVLNDQWEVVALHHSGVPRRDDQGRILARDGSLWQEAMGDEFIDRVANEGVRVSRIVASVKAARLDGPQAQRRDELLGASAPIPSPSVVRPPRGRRHELRYREAIRTAPLEGGGQPPRSRRSLDDRGGSSARAEAGAEMARTGGQACAERAARASLLQAEVCGADQPDAAPLTPPAAGFPRRRPNEPARGRLEDHAKLRPPPRTAHPARSPQAGHAAAPRPPASRGRRRSSHPRRRRSR